jgi:hypothetical protein
MSETPERIIENNNVTDFRNNTNVLFDTVTIAKNGNSTSTDVIRLDYMKVNGTCSIQIEVTGAGSATIEAVTSITGTDFVRSSTETAIVTGFTATSGKDSNGKDLLPVKVNLANYLKIKVTEEDIGEIVVTVTIVNQ